MRYLTMTPAEADARSAAEATARGCKGVTTRWWAVETDGRNACLLIDDGDEGTLSGAERAALSATEPRWLAARREATATALKAATPRT